MAEKNPKLKNDDYTRRLSIPDESKRNSLCDTFKISESYLYRLLSAQRFDIRYPKKRALQDEVRFKAWEQYGALFVNITFTRK